MKEQLLNELKQSIELANHYRDMYYNHDISLVSDEEYDALFDKIARLEKETGVYYSDSPTQSVGYKTVSKLEKYIHETPLLSLDKTKLVNDLIEFMKKGSTTLGLKLDGLTTELIYEDGKLVMASTRGDGVEGENILHNALHIIGVPKEISYKSRLRVVGESIMRLDDYIEYCEKIGDDSPARNIAAGSVRQLSSQKCAERKIRFIPFAVLDGFENYENKSEKMEELKSLGFEHNNYAIFEQGDFSEEYVQKIIDELIEVAKERKLPIDGLVLSYDNIEYGKSLGKTEHHFKDGIAFKFYDEKFETTFRGIELNPTRTGMVSLTILFDTVVIDNSDVSRATGHNIDIFESFKFGIGDKITVYKANQIIPKVAENLTQSNTYKLPMICPCCGSELVIRAPKDSRFLFCDNENCTAKLVRKFTHYVSKPCANIDGLSKATVERFVEKGWIKTFKDIYHLSNYRTEIIEMSGFGETSYNKLIASIEESKNIKLENYINAIGIPNIGKKTAKDISKYFGGDYSKFITAIEEKFDFSKIADIGEITNVSIYEWAEDEIAQSLILGLANELNFEIAKSENQNNVFAGKTFVVTGSLMNYTRDSIVEEIEKYGGKCSSSVSKNTDYLLAGEKAGSKLEKAKKIGVTVITETEFENLKNN